MSQPARFCIRCGAAVPVADSRFCFSCGAEIVSPGLIAEQTPLPDQELETQRPTQEPHEEPPAAPPPSSTPGTGPQGGGIDPIQAVVSGFTRCMELGGRSSRSEFWWFYLFTGSVFLLTLIMAGLIGAVVGAGGAVTCISLNILVLWPYIAVGVRRLHDSGRDGWLILIGLVPGFGWIVVLVWWVSPSNEGSNRYGPNPNQRTQNPPHTPDRETPVAQEPTLEHQIPPDVDSDNAGQESAEWNYPSIIKAVWANDIAAGCLVVAAGIIMLFLVMFVIYGISSL